MSTTQTPADRRAALARARDLVVAGSPLAEAARAVGLSIDALKRASSKHGWCEERAAADPPPLTLGRDPTEATIAEQAQALIREAITSGRPVKVSDAILIERWAAEKERSTRTSEAPDLSGVPDSVLEAAREAWARVEACAAGRPYAPAPDYLYSPLDLARRRIAELEQVIARLGGAETPAKAPRAPA